MRLQFRRPFTLATLLLILVAGVLFSANAGNLKTAVFHPNASGVAESYFASGSLDTTNEFFQSLGTNGRSCSSCHQEDQGWTITPERVQDRFNASDGTDPIFRPVDGAVCPTADVSTVQARRVAYKMLLTRGLVRISMAVPPGAEFQLVAVDDPYGCANAGDIAMFRRPLPATNLRFLSTVMWDGRESPKGRSLHDNLMSQANDATTGHAQGVSPNATQLADIVQFEMAVATAQTDDVNAGNLNAQGANGGPQALNNQEYYIGINDALGGDPEGQPFNPNAMTVYSAWANIPSSQADKWTAARQSVARGEQLFNSFPIPITGVAGLNDALNQQVIMGTCTTCHDAPNVGNHSVALAINIGVTDATPAAPLDTTGLPVYTLKCTATGTTYTVTDPGRALITGKCADIGKTKGPILRGLASRAPYFHNGSAATLRDAVDFYDNRFNLGLSEQDKADLVAFLQTL